MTARPRNRALGGLIFLAAAVGPTLEGSRAAGPRVDVLVGPAAGDLERLAARELVVQLERQCHAAARIVTDWQPGVDPLIAVGCRDSNPVIQRAIEPRLLSSTEGLVLRSLRIDDRPVLVLAGGSPAASLRAVYELGHRLGIRYSIRGDIHSPTPRPLPLDGFDVVMAPRLALRAWRGMDDSPIGMEAWGTSDQERLMAQLVKLKFNAIVLSLRGWQPFADFGIEGGQKETSVLFRGRRFEIGGQTVGRRAFAGAAFFDNPDLAGKVSAAERTAAGIRLLQGVIDRAQKRGLEVLIEVRSNDLPPESRPLVGRVVRSTYPGVMVIEHDDLAAAQGSSRKKSDREAAGVLPRAILDIESLVGEFRAADETRRRGVLLPISVPGTLDPSLHYLARASFDAKVTAGEAFLDFFRGIVDEEAVAQRLVRAFEAIGRATQLQRENAEFFAADDPEWLMRRLNAGEPPPGWWKELAALHTEAMTEMYRAHSNCPPRAQPLVYYWAKRQQFAVDYLTCVSAVRLAGVARRAGDEDAATTQLEMAVEALYNGLTHLGDVAKDPSDRGLVVLLNEYAYRPLQKALEETER